VELRIFDQGHFGGNWSLAEKHLFVSKTRNSHSQFSSNVDADAQVLLHCGLGGKLFAADLANVFRKNYSFVRSEINQSGKIVTAICFATCLDMKMLFVFYPSIHFQV